MTKYDYLIIGAGLYGAVFAHEATKRGKRCLVLEKRDHIGGNCYTENTNGINVHKYGAHIFHTSDRDIWDYVNQFVTFNNYINSPIANYKGHLYNLPFNMNTFYQLWGVCTPREAKAKIEEQKAEYSHITMPKNLEEQALVLGGRDIYEKLVKGYSEKQWGRKATEIPAFIIQRLPFRFTFDNNYFNDCYQGIPIGGYTALFKKLLENTEVRLNCNFFDNRELFSNMSQKTVYTGPIDAYYNYCYGRLDYRSLHFEHELLEDTDNFQGNAVINYTDTDTPYTRIIEHKHFEFNTLPHSVITREYPIEWTPGEEPYYPVNNKSNNALYQKYKELSNQENKVLFGGRLAEYRYYDMHQIIKKVINHDQFNF